MLSLTRQGARVLVIAAGDTDSVSKCISLSLPATEYSVREGIDRAEPDQTVVLLSSTSDVEEFSSSLVVEALPEEVIQWIFNSGVLPGDAKIRLLPRVIHFRVTGKPEYVLEQICRDFNGKRGKLGELINDTSDRGIAVLFTDKPLNRNLRMEDHFKDILYIDMPEQLLFRELQWRAVSYFNEGLEGKEWNLVEIRIYDAYSSYPLHCKRLRLFLEACEMGLTIGEGWGKDYAHILMPLSVYTMKILTFYQPYVLKKALMGLEYTNDGRRFVDFDLYSKKKKISWTELSSADRKDRKGRAMEFRAETMAELTDFYKHEILAMEKDIEEDQTRRKAGKD